MRIFLSPGGFRMIASLITILSAFWIWLSAAPPGTTTAGVIPAPQAGFLAPDFTLTDQNGGLRTLSELRGRPVLVNFWASWCRPCRSEMPAMQRTYETYQEGGLEILAVNATNQDSISEAVGFGQELDLTFPILFDTDGEVSRLYEVRAFPTSFFIDRDGLIREVIVGGPMAEALLRVRAEQLLEGNP